MFNIIARRTLNEYAELYPEAKMALQKWYYELVESDFRNFNDLKKAYTNASLVADDKHHPVAFPDTIAVIKLHMKEHGMKNKHLEPMIGSKSYVSQVVNKQKPLTADMMRALHKKPGIPANILLAA